MRVDFRSLAATMAAIPLLTGCLATRGQLRELRTTVETQQTAQQTALATEKSERQATDAELKAANDALRQERRDRTLTCSCSSRTSMP